MKSLLESIFGKKEDIAADAKDMILWTGWDEAVASFNNKAELNDDYCIHPFKWIPPDQRDLDNILKSLFWPTKKNLGFEVTYGRNQIHIRAGLHLQDTVNKVYQGQQKRVCILAYLTHTNFKSRVLAVVNAFRKHPEMLDEIMDHEKDKFGYGLITYPDFEKKYINK